jgi:hypothetical protein
VRMGEGKPTPPPSATIVNSKYLKLLGVTFNEADRKYLLQQIWELVHRLTAACLLSQLLFITFLNPSIPSFCFILFNHQILTYI